MPTRTFIACFSPPGAGAIATLAVRGPQAWSITRSLFRTRLPDQPIPGTFYLGRLGEESSACDEVVLAVKPELLELHCHGGVEVVRFIQELFAARGVLNSSWEELSPASVSRLRRLAQEQLVQAPTVKTAAILLDQLHGAFEKRLADILACLYHHDVASAARLLSRLAQTQHLGRHLVEPFRVVIAGAPNVGKSSLVNALAGYTRTVVSPIPGTTRDVVTTRIALDGWPVELVDTAGLRTSEDPLEREGMARARAVLDKADLRLWVLDASAPPRFPPPEISFDRTIIHKADLPLAWDDGDFRSRLPSTGWYVSSKTGQGVTELCQWMVFLLGREQVLAPGEGVAFTPELCERILHAYESLRENGEGTRRILEEMNGDETTARGLARS